MAHFLQQGRIFSHKVTPHNSITPLGVCVCDIFLQITIQDQQLGSDVVI